MDAGALVVPEAERVGGSCRLSISASVPASTRRSIANPAVCSASSGRRRAVQRECSTGRRRGPPPLRTVAHEPRHLDVASWPNQDRETPPRRASRSSPVGQRPRAATASVRISHTRGGCGPFGSRSRRAPRRFSGARETCRIDSAAPNALAVGIERELAAAISHFVSHEAVSTEVRLRLSRGAWRRGRPRAGLVRGSRPGPRAPAGRPTPGENPVGGFPWREVWWPPMGRSRGASGPSVCRLPGAVPLPYQRPCPPRPLPPSPSQAPRPTPTNTAIRR